MKKHLLALPLLFTLAGCAGSGKTTVLIAPTERYIAHTYTLVEGNSTVDCNEAVKRYLEQEVRSGLDKANMTQGNDLIIEYRFIQFNKGSRVARYFTGGLGNAGEGEMTIEIIFKNENNQELNRIQVGGKISWGFFGGSFDNAVKQSANQVVRYVIANF